jgi:tetratricopeptide (TPR) repeat protein
MISRIKTSEPRFLNNLAQYLANNIEHCCFLFGAGISVSAPSSVPIARTMLDALIRHSTVGLSDSTIEEILNPSPMQLMSGNHIRFEFICEAIEKATGSLRFLNFLSAYKTPNQNHINLSLLLDAGAILATTNFDTLIESTDKFRSSQHAMRDLSVNKDTSIKTGCLYKLHGSIPYTDDSSLGATLQSLRKTDTQNRIKRFIHDVAQSHNIVVMGYSGYDDFDISPALSSAPYVKYLIWVDHNAQNENYSAHLFAKTDSNRFTKAAFLLEKIIAINPALADRIIIVEGNTERLLRDITASTNQIAACSRHDIRYNNEIDKLNPINIHYLNNLHKGEKVCITIQILNFQERYNEAISLFNSYFTRDEIPHLITSSLTSRRLVNAYIMAEVADNSDPDLPSFLSSLEESWKASQDKHQTTIFFVNSFICNICHGQKEQATRNIDLAIGLAEEIDDKELILKTLYNKRFVDGIDLLSQEEIDYMHFLAICTSDYEMLSKIEHIMGSMSGDYSHFTNSVNYAILHGKLSGLINAIGAAGVYDSYQYHKIISMIASVLSDFDKIVPVLDNAKMPNGKKLLFLMLMARIVYSQDENKSIAFYESALDACCNNEERYSVLVVYLLALSEKCKSGGGYNTETSLKAAQNATSGIDMDEWKLSSPESYIQCQMCFCIMLYNSGRTLEAEKQLNDVITDQSAFNVDDFDADMFDYYYCIGRLDLAENILPTVVKNTKSEEKLFGVQSLYGNILFNRKQHRQAIDVYKSVIGWALLRHPNCMSAPLYNIAKALLLVQRLELSMKFLVLSYQFDPHDRTEDAASLLKMFKALLGESVVAEELRLASSIAFHRTGLKAHIDSLIIMAEEAIK